MINFIDYSPEALRELSPIIKQSPYKSNDISLGSFLMWNKSSALEFAVLNDTFISRAIIDGAITFSYPFGKDVDGALKALCEYSKDNNIPLVFYCVEEEMLDMLDNNPYFSVTEYSYDRRWSDYLYDFSEMETFPGRKFSGQRNHINKYKKLYGEPDLRPIKKEDLLTVHKMLEEYYISREEPSTELENEEFCRTYELLEQFEELGMYCGGLYAEDKLIGFTIGEIIGDMLILHVEKALTKYTGVYPTLFNSFIRYMKEISPINLNIINREDDSGDEGLRTSKIQYKPIQILHKYTVKTKIKA